MAYTTLVTGAAGFIGSHVVDELVARGHDVVAFDDLSGGFAENVSTAARFVKGSITDRDQVALLFRQHRFDFIFHLAAYAAEGLSHFIKTFNYTNNLLGSVNLVNAAVNQGSVRCFVFTSSIAVYGRGQVPMREEQVPRPEDPYGIAKYAVELDLQESREMFGMNYIVFRPHNVYGERQNIADPYRNVIGIFMNQILQGKPMTIFGDGLQKRAFTHVSEVAPILADSIARPEVYNHVFNIGSDNVTSVLDLAGQVASAMGVKPDIRHLDTRHEVGEAYCSHDKAKAFFACSAHSPTLSEGLAKMAQWVRRHGARQGQPFRAIEVDRNMPRSWRSLLDNTLLTATGRT